MANNPEGVRSVLRTSEPYLAWIKLLAAVDLVGWGAFELWARLDAVGWTHDGLWNARTSVWSVLVLFDILVIVWWYADLANKQYRLAETTRSESIKPFAVIDQTHGFEADHRPSRYVARNIGPGLAVNVLYVVEDDAGLSIQSIGALAGHAERALPESLQRPLRDAHGATHRFLVVSEGLPTQPSRWTATANVLLPTGEVAHRVLRLEPEKRSESLRAWLEFHWPDVKTQLAVLENQK
jgi:hypothetical protein